MEWLIGLGQLDFVYGSQMMQSTGYNLKYFINFSYLYHYLRCVDLGDSWYSECWRLFRWWREGLQEFLGELRVPHMIQISGDNNGIVRGEYASLYMIQVL